MWALLSLCSSLGKVPESGCQATEVITEGQQVEKGGPAGTVCAKRRLRTGACRDDPAQVQREVRLLEMRNRLEMERNLGLVACACHPSP